MCIVLRWWLICLEKHYHAIQNVGRKKELKREWNLNLRYESLHLWEAQISRRLWKMPGLLLFSAPFLKNLKPMLQYFCWSCSRTKVVFFPSFTMNILASGYISLFTSSGMAPDSTINMAWCSWSLQGQCANFLFSNLNIRLRIMEFSAWSVCQRHFGLFVFLCRRAGNFTYQILSCHRNSGDLSPTLVL